MGVQDVAALLAASLGAIAVPALWALVCFVRRAEARTRRHALLMVGMALALGVVQGAQGGEMGAFIALGRGIVIGAGLTVLTVAFALAAGEQERVVSSSPKSDGEYARRRPRQR